MTLYTKSDIKITSSTITGETYIREVPVEYHWNEEEGKFRYIIITDLTLNEDEDNQVLEVLHKITTDN